MIILGWALCACDFYPFIKRQERGEKSVKAFAGEVKFLTLNR